VHRKTVIQQVKASRAAVIPQENVLERFFTLTVYLSSWRFKDFLSLKQ